MGNYCRSNGVYFDTSSKAGVMGKGRNARHAEYRAEVVFDKLRIRRRFKSYKDAQDWIQKMKDEGIRARYK